MTTLTVTMLWNDHHQKWLMINAEDKLLYDFFDCRTVNEAFKNLDKMQAKKYTITVNPIE